jgi:hypothetical protein
VDWRRNDEICTAVILGRPVPRHREVVEILAAPIPPAPAQRIEYRDRVVVKEVVREVPGPTRVEYRDRFVAPPSRGPCCCPLA